MRAKNSCPTALLRLFPVIAPKLRNAHAERQDVHDAILNTRANHYPVSAADNVLAFHCGVVLLELRSSPKPWPCSKCLNRS